jgi:putative resolvase
MPRYVGYQRVREQFDISAQTIKNWALRGSIDFKWIQNDTRKTWLYDPESIGRYIDSKQVDTNSTEKPEKTVIYCRVSSKKQESDLDRQVLLLTSAYPDYEVIKDIGSGLNFKRPGFSRMVEQICRGEVSRVVVTYKDRLMRFGYEFFKQICKENSCKIMVYSKEFELFDVEDEETRELQEDLLSIINVFVARRNGKRAGQLRRERKRLEETKKFEEIKEAKKTTTKLGNENKVISN